METILKDTRKNPFPSVSVKDLFLCWFQPVDMICYGFSLKHFFIRSFELKALIHKRERRFLKMDDLDKLFQREDSWKWMILNRG